MTRASWAHAGTVALVKAAVSALVLALGFRAISDDDYARVVIAEQWARAPRWDASGTSWLPFPLWLTGAALCVFGRGIGVARAVAVVLGVVSALLVYLAARWLGEDRRAAAFGAVVAAGFPWSAYLGVATVPELPAAALTLLGVAALFSPGPRRDIRRLWGAAALSAAALSRYEAWPIALLFAGVCAIDAVRAKDARAAVAAVLSLLGPLAWLANNRLAHGDPLHFLTRVAAYRRALGALGEDSAAARLWAYPAAMLREEPGVAALLLAATAVTLARSPTARAALLRYARAAALLAAQVGALSLAMLKDGAPTHHPERAVFAALLLAAVCAGAMTVHASTSWAWLLGAPACAVVLTVLVARHAAREPFAARGDQEAVGRAAAALASPGDRVLLEVEDHGYLAVIAAMGRPEDTVQDRSVDPREAKVPSSFDDAGALSRRVAASGARWVVARVSPVTRAALGEASAVRGAWGVFPVREGGGS